MAEMKKILQVESRDSESQFALYDTVSLIIPTVITNERYK